MSLRDNNTVGSRIFIGNLKTSVITNEELIEKFQVHGQIVANLIKKGFAFVQFENDLAAQEAIKNENGQMFKGKKMEVKPARVNKPIPPSHQKQPRQQKDPGEYRDLSPVSDRSLRENEWRENRERYGNESTSRDSFYGRSDPDGYDNPEDYNEFEEINMKMNYDADKSDFPKKHEFDVPPSGRNQVGGGGPPFRLNDSLRVNKPFTETSNFGLKDSFSQPCPPFRGNPLPMPGPPRNSDNEKPVLRTSLNANDIISNDCEIIIASKDLRDYGEYIESRLKKAGLRVDILLPKEEVPLGRILGSISSRGTLYAVVIHPQNLEHRSLTVNTLQGEHHEHRNMPLEDAINFIIRNLEKYRREKSLNQLPQTGPMPIVPGPGSNFDDTGIKNIKLHPEAIQKLISLLIDNRSLTVLQYDKLLYYLKRRRDEQVRTELGENKELASTVEREAMRKEEELKKRIMGVINKPPPTSTPTTKPSESFKDSLPASSSCTNASLGWSSDSAATKAAPLLNDPNVQKALDSLIQGDLLRKITSSAHSTNSSGPSYSGTLNPIFGTAFKQF